MPVSNALLEGDIDLRGTGAGFDEQDGSPGTADRLPSRQFGFFHDRRLTSPERPGFSIANFSRAAKGRLKPLTGLDLPQHLLGSFTYLVKEGLMAESEFTARRKNREQSRGVGG